MSLTPERELEIAREARAAETMRANAAVARAKKMLDTADLRRAEVEKERDHWKANHADVVRRKQASHRFATRVWWALKNLLEHQYDGGGLCCINIDDAKGRDVYNAAVGLVIDAKKHERERDADVYAEVVGDVVMTDAEVRAAVVNPGPRRALLEAHGIVAGPAINECGDCGATWADGFEKHNPGCTNTAHLKADVTARIVAVDFDTSAVEEG